MHNTNQQQVQKSDPRWLHLDRFNHLHVKLNVQEGMNSDLSITCREGVMPYGQSTDLDTYLNL
jgi:hypothetical protein